MRAQCLKHYVLKETLCTTSSVSEWGEMNSEKLCGDPEHRFTLCEINSIKTDNINGSIKKISALLRLLT